MFRLDAQEQGFPFTPASPNTHGQEYSQRIERITNCFFPSVILAFLRLSSSPSVCHPRLPPSVILDLLPSVILAFFLLSSSPSSFLSSSTLVIEDPVSLPFPSFVRRTTLDSCFRRNDSRLPFSLLCSGGISWPYNCLLSLAALTASWRCPFLGGLCRRHEMPPLQLHNDPGFLLSQE